MDTNSWIYNKHKFLFELQSMFHPCINQKPRYWLPPYKKEKNCKNSIYKRVYNMLIKIYGKVFNQRHVPKKIRINNLHKRKRFRQKKKKKKSPLGTIPPSCVPTHIQHNPKKSVPCQTTNQLNITYIYIEDR
jgi:hypothetical protein